MESLRPLSIKEDKGTSTLMRYVVPSNCNSATEPNPAVVVRPTTPYVFSVKKRSIRTRDILEGMVLSLVDLIC